MVSKITVYLDTKRSRNNNTVMKKELKLRRKVSAIVAVALAMVVTFFAGLDSYGDASTDPIERDDIGLAIAEAYDEIVEEAFVPSISVESAEVIKIYNRDNELIKEIQVGEDEIIQDENVQMLLNRAEYMSSFHNTSVYRVFN